MYLQLCSSSFHHKIVHSRCNLNICFSHLINAKYEIRKGFDSANYRKVLLDSINWTKLFDQTDINAQGSVPTETRLIVFLHYVPIKYITVIDDKDPVWMNENIKSKIKR